MGGILLVAAFGITFGNLKTYQWLTSMVVNFFWNIFIESLIKVCLKKDKRKITIENLMNRLVY